MLVTINLPLRPLANTFAQGNYLRSRAKKEGEWSAGQRCPDKAAKKLKAEAASCVYSEWNPDVDRDTIERECTTSLPIYRAQITILYSILRLTLFGSRTFA